MTSGWETFSEGRLRQGQRRRLYLAAGLMGCLLHLMSGAAGAATLLDDFESGLAGLTGTLSNTGPAEAPRPNTQSGMRVSPVGAGACNNLIGESLALCGADTKKWAGFDGARLSYAVDFDRVGALLFDLAAWSVRDPFDPWNGERPDEWGDYVRVQAVSGGGSTLLAEFTGTMVPGMRQGLVSTDAGLLLGAGMVIDAYFRTVFLDGLNRLFTGTGELVFQFRSTGSAEQMGIDNIRLLPPPPPPLAAVPAPVPLPASLPLALLGLGLLAGLGRLKRG